ncbi:MAG: hypothetical protein LUH18_09590 [Oscillospiraceae bacterium]|nr:hypothetical protein [Oscillospiraceae bacterium]
MTKFESHEMQITIFSEREAIVTGATDSGPWQGGMGTKTNSTSENWDK